MKTNYHALPYFSACFFSALCITACSTLTKQKTTDATLVPTTQPPYMWYPFHENAVQGKDCLSAKEYTNRLPIQEKPLKCAAVVDSLDVLPGGAIDGPLRFNCQYRHVDSGDDQDYSFAQVSQNNSELGPVQAGNLYLYYKYEGKIVFSGEKANCFYGQMISDLIPITPPNPAQLVFHPFMPENDAIDMQWYVKGDASFVDFKKQYPINALEDAAGSRSIVRFIEAPGGGAGVMNIGYEGKKLYVMVYAGVCNRITHVKVFRISYPAGQPPVLNEIQEGALHKEVSSFTYQTIP